MNTNLQEELASVSIATNRGGETRSRRAFARGVDASAGGQLLLEFEELRLGSSRVTQQQHVDVSPESHSVWQVFPRSTKELTRESLLDVRVSTDCRRYRCCYLGIKVRFSRKLLKLLFLFVLVVVV